MEVTWQGCGKRQSGGSANEKLESPTTVVKQASGLVHCASLIGVTGARALSGATLTTETEVLPGEVVKRGIIAPGRNVQGAYALAPS